MEKFYSNLLFLFFFLFVFNSYSQQKGNCLKEEFDKLHSRTKYVRDSIAVLKKSVEIKIKDESDVLKRGLLILELDSLHNVSDRNDIEELKIDIQFCKQNPDCLYSFDLVNAQVSRQPGKNFYKEFEFIYNNASKGVRDSESGKKMAEKLKYFKQSMVGSLAPDFSGNDINGKRLSLSDFKHKKYVLIDFWASWCKPCIEDIPFLKIIGEKYKGKLEIISISDDEDINRLIEAIVKEEIEEWTHFSIKQNESSVRKDYFVNGIPHKVLIDMDGKIIGKWKGSGELNKNEIKNILYNVFGF
jgi:thiol-disulfide isomerase/thioredoxin